MAVTPDGRIFAPIFEGQLTDDPEYVARMAANPDTKFHPEYIMSHGGAWRDPFTGERIGGVQDLWGRSDAITGEELNPYFPNVNPNIIRDPNLVQDIRYDESGELIGRFIPEGFRQKAEEIYQENLARHRGLDVLASAGIDASTLSAQDRLAWTNFLNLDPVTMGDDDPPAGDTCPVGTHWNGTECVSDEDPPAGDGDPDVRAKMQSAFYAALRVAGMEKDLIDKLWDWAETELVNDPSFTAERALLGMYDSDAFRTRFKAIADMTDAGYGRRDMPTPGEYIAFEKDVANELKRVGVVEQGASFDNLITSLYMNSVGLGEVTDRLNTAQRVMYEMPSAVRDKLTDWFGDEYGTSITMKTFLDPTDDWSAVQDDISTAQTGGWGQMVAGLNAGWDENLAKQVSDLGLSQAEQWNRFARLKEQEMLFTETLDETLDLDYATEGVRAEFGLPGSDNQLAVMPGDPLAGMSGYELSDLITKRGQKRSARFSGGGGALMSGTTTGFGAANA